MSYALWVTGMVTVLAAATFGNLALAIAGTALVGLATPWNEEHPKGDGE
jgi:hypothetical protein